MLLLLTKWWGRRLLHDRRHIRCVTHLSRVLLLMIVSLNWGRLRRRDWRFAKTGKLFQLDIWISTRIHLGFVHDPKNRLVSDPICFMELEFRLVCGRSRLHDDNGEKCVFSLPFVDSTTLQGATSLPIKMGNTLENGFLEKIRSREIRCK